MDRISRSLELGWIRVLVVLRLMTYHQRLGQLGIREGWFLVRIVEFMV